MKQNGISTGEYLFFLSAKYEVSFDGLLKGLVLARQNSEVSCGKLSIRCRRRTAEYDVFLITTGYQVVAQFPVSKYYLDQPDQIRAPTEGRLFRHFVKRATQEGPLHVGDLRCGMKKVNVTARVLNVSKPTFVFTRFGGYARVAVALIADETGTIKLCLWNEKIDEVSAGSVIELKDASVVRFRGEKQLKLGRNGQLKVIAKPLPTCTNAIKP
ncbi:MAG: hypothetical protein QXM22_04505 [Candidatus Bathyarchaeia archaeon]